MHKHGFVTIVVFGNIDAVKYKDVQEIRINYLNTWLSREINMARFGLDFSIWRSTLSEESSITSNTRISLVPRKKQSKKYRSLTRDNCPLEISSHRCL